jgi:hypothetical protein
MDCVPRINLHQRNSDNNNNNNNNINREPSQDNNKNKRADKNCGGEISHELDQFVRAGLTGCGNAIPNTIVDSIRI